MELNRIISNQLAQHATSHPHAPAILALDRAPLSYAGLYYQLYQTVEKLNQLGISRNDPVAIVLPNGPEMAMAFLTAAACATAAPLNPAYRAAEFDFYLGDLNAKAVIVQTTIDSPVRDVAMQRNIPLIELIPDVNTAGLFTLDGEPTRSDTRVEFAEADDVALILHTSGTTSRPKMVPLTQHNICTSAQNIINTLQLTSQDRCLNVMPLFHIHGLMAATLSSLMAGGSLVCTSGFDVEQFFPSIESFQPTWYTAVPTMHQAILSMAKEHHETINSHPLRLIRSSSASLPPQVMAGLEEIFNAPVIESYGMTEAAHQMSSNPLPPHSRKPSSVGVPAGPEIAIMDETSSSLLAQGKIGEIIIRGENVTSGYANNPNANQEAFSNGWFRTGDQGYFDPDGYLFLTGRLKEIINRGGEKIAPREVDEILLAHPAVSQAITFAIPHATLGEDVAAAVVLEKHEQVFQRELRHFAFERLADYKVPTQILVVDEIPKGPTGKLQRIGLAEKLAIQLRPEFAEPTEPVEKILAQIWGEVLNQNRIGIDDNFFALGGDSLKAVQVVARVRATLEITLPLPAIFQEPILADQALFIEEILLNEIEGLSEEDMEQSPLMSNL